MNNNNRLIKIQEMLYNQMKRLDDDNLMIKGLGQREIQRSGALSQSACAYIKTVGVSLKVRQMTKGNPSSENTVLRELGVLKDDAISIDKDEVAK